MEQVGSQDGPKRPQDVPKMGPRGFRCFEMLQDGPKMLRRWPQDAPRGSQDGPKMPQEASKMGPGGPKMRTQRVSWSKLAPKMAPRGPKRLPRWAQEAPRCSKMLQDGPKMLPRWPQDAPRCSQDGSKTPQEAPEMSPRGPKRRAKNVKKTIGFYRFSYIEGIMEQVGG